MQNFGYHNITQTPEPTISLLRLSQRVWMAIGHGHVNCILRFGNNWMIENSEGRGGVCGQCG